MNDNRKPTRLLASTACALLIALPLCVSCKRNDVGPQQAARERPAAAVELQVTTLADVRKRIAEQPGKVVVLDLWALW